MRYDECVRCGQQHADDGDNVCWPCREQDRAPQGFAGVLFRPAPAQLPGQTFFEQHGREMSSDEQRADRWARLDARSGLRADR